MNSPHHHGESTRLYRHGAIMGFTVAETFMLLVFALLLLLLLWRNDLLERLRTAEEFTNDGEPIVAQTVTGDAVRAIVQIPESKRHMLVELMSADRFAESIEHQRALLKNRGQRRPA